jgi:hypothetical protein
MVPVVLRPYSGEILYSWLARTAAVYGVDHSDLLGFPATPWDLLAAPAPETLRGLAEFTRMPETALADLTIAGTDLPQRWWSIRQITPDPFAPNMEYTYHPTITFCRLCLWNDFITDGNEYLRLKWMAAVPTICPSHRVPMEDSCNFCSAWGLPISERTSRGFRFVCADCKRPFASPQIIGRTTLSPEILILLEFEAALRDALKNERNLRFPGAWIGPKSFLQMVEDLSWLLTRRTEGNGRLFVHHLNRTVFHISRRLYCLPQSRPWLGDFDARNRLGLLSYIAALVGGRWIRERLFLNPSPGHSGMAEALTWLCSSDRSTLRHRVAAWPQIGRNTVFTAAYIQLMQDLYTN